jgi:putative FmdB family regulatory protein
LPIYEYMCTSCGDRFEVMQRLSDPPLSDCQLCKGKVRKLLGTPALQFKGTGWYITDYAGKNGSAPSNGPTKDSTKDSKEPASGGDAKKEAPAACACGPKGCGHAGGE